MARLFDPSSLVPAGLVVDEVLTEADQLAIRVLMSFFDQMIPSDREAFNDSRTRIA